MESELPISELQTVHMSTLVESIEEKVMYKRKKIKSNIVDAALEKLGLSIELCSILPKQQFETASQLNTIK